MTKFIPVLLLDLLLIMSLVGPNFVPQSHATLTGENWVEEITTIPAEVNVVASDSAGRLFLGADNNVYRSADAGATWTKVLDGPSGFPGFPYLLFVDSRDYVYAMITNATLANSQLYRSTDNGLSWSKVLSDIPLSWHMSEAPNGDLYFNTYSTDSADLIYRSTDTGASWSIFYDLTGVIDHFHWVEAAPNGQIYISTGDGQYDSTIQRYNLQTSSWNLIANDTTTYEPLRVTSIFFDDSYGYFMNDASQISYRMPFTGNSTDDFEAIFDHRVLFQSSNNVYDAAKIGEVYLAGFSEGQVWASWDGEHWVKLFDSGISGNIIRSFTRRGHPIYFTNDGAHKLYRLSIRKEDIIQLYYKEYNVRRGSLTNAEDYILEQRIWNGSTNYLDLTNVGLSDVKVSIKGLSFSNILNNNAGFEWGNKTGWIESGSPLGAIDFTAKANGTYSYKIVKSASDTAKTLLKQPVSVSVKRGDIAVLSFYAKSNVSIPQSLWVAFYNDTTATKAIKISPTTIWRKYTFNYVVSDESKTMSYFVIFPIVDQTTWIDSVLFYISQTAIICGAVGSTDSISYADEFQHPADHEQADWYKHPSYFNGTKNTINPTLTIAGQSVSYSGSLTNGTESPATSLSGILTGAVKVEASIQGSGQAILHLTGTRVLYEDSIILKARKDNVYYGRYYGTFSPTTTTTDLIAVTNLASNIISLSYASNKLILTTDSHLGTMSTTKVYVGNMERPTSVRGATTWSYDETGMVLTLTANHTATNTVTTTLNWNPLGDINSDGTVNRDDLTVFNLAYGLTPLSPNWNPDADLNEDNIIDAKDLLPLGKNYGKDAN